MAIPSISDFILYTDTALTKDDFTANLQTFVDYLADGTTDLDIGKLSTIGNLTAIGTIDIEENAEINGDVISASGVVVDGETYGEVVKTAHIVDDSILTAAYDTKVFTPIKMWPTVRFMPYYIGGGVEYKTDCSTGYTITRYNTLTISSRDDEGRGYVTTGKLFTPTTSGVIIYLQSGWMEPDGWSHASLRLKIAVYDGGANPQYAALHSYYTNYNESELSDPTCTILINRTIYFTGLTPGVEYLISLQYGKYENDGKLLVNNAASDGENHWIRIAAEDAEI